MKSLIIFRGRENIVRKAGLVWENGHVQTLLFKIVKQS